MIKIDYDKCCWQDGKCSSPPAGEAGCGCGGGACVGCAEACPVQAISRQNSVVVNNNLCIDCGACVAACQHGAISMV